MIFKIIDKLSELTVYYQYYFCLLNTILILNECFPVQLCYSNHLIFAFANEKVKLSTTEIGIMNTKQFYNSSY